ncbi:hypothetical protein D3C75_706330 [compost metagenome]
MGHVQLAIQLQAGGRTVQHQRATGQQHAVGADQVSVDAVVAQPLAEQIGEVQAQTTTDGVEVEQAEHPQRRGAALDLEQLALARLDRQTAAEMLEAGHRRRTRPVPVDLDLEAAAGDARRITPGQQHVGQVLAGQATPVVATAVQADALPVQAAVQAQALEIEIELVEARPIGAGPAAELPAAEAFLAQIQGIDAYVHGRQTARIDLGQRIAGRNAGRLALRLRQLRLARRQTQALQLDAQRRSTVLRQHGAAPELRIVQLQAPALPGAAQVNPELLQAQTADAEAVNPQRQRLQQAAQTLSLAGVGIACLRGLPGRPVELTELATDVQAEFPRQLCGCAAKTQLAPASRQLAGRSGKIQVGQARIAQRVAALVTTQGHPPIGTARLLGRLAQRRRQVDARALQIRADP